MFLHVKSQGDSQPPKLIIGHAPRALLLPEQILLPFELVSLSRRNVLWIDQSVQRSESLSIDLTIVSLERR
jgi:hypothetical protein